MKNVFAFAGLPSFAGLAFICAMAAVPARGNLVMNGAFTSCTPTFSSSSSCPTSNFAIGTAGTGTAYNLSNWTISSTSNLHCVGVGLVNTDLCGAGWNFGHSSDHLQMFALPTSIPGGGNWVLIDGSSQFNASLSQTVSGLTPGVTYTLRFEQSAGQEVLGSPGGASTDFWQVGFCATPPCSTTSGSATQNQMVVQPGSSTFIGWTQVAYNFTATSVTQTLSFLAMGNGAPPFVFLTDVQLNVATPEPSPLFLMFPALLAIPFVRRRREAARLKRALMVKRLFDDQ